MNKKLKIYFICGNGLGSSLACQMVVEDVLSKEKIEADLEHESISSAPGLRTDIIVSAENFKMQFEKFEMDPEIHFVFLHNIVSENEIKEKLIPVIKELSE
ncbi:PTS sugar transporter subunit IIB [Liquorilactobacillus mali]|nr:PTS sugar transporter subunit IIB [Liquorilactobacillus mali]EJE97523.1 phosphotransferase system, galactitol-specific IIB component [Liquorilactobacillus mali KCTC 3596 = DSM 20444]MDC7954134.1 PTS sugar transporter subunit IIB [Liquorilactobacillus mali]MDV7757703.1 PTS ascorbate transporter subunit IIB [Liquorilactobacillus mali]QFQ73776.1 PTS sugar transporter subunit IIB [Liquorilactobacillus mali]